MKQLTLEQIEEIIKEIFFNFKLQAPIEIGLNAELSGSHLKESSYYFTVYQRERNKDGLITHRFSAKNIEEVKVILKRSIKEKNITV